ncbi:MAG: hypothetical protein ACJAVK_002077 [Akkermansiaceae bacterium]|jgi:hypothetical protein
MKTSKQNNITSVYRNQNVLIRAVFQRAGDTRRSSFSPLRSKGGFKALPPKVDS